jgi:hypothetical protein
MSGLIGIISEISFTKGRSGRGPTTAISPFNTLKIGEFVDAGFAHKFPDQLLTITISKKNSITFGIILHTLNLK